MKRKENLKLLQKLVDYEFKDENLLAQALTTPQLGHELGIPNYDILETLGDAVLKAVLISKKIKEGYTNPEDITKTKQMIENDLTLGQIAVEYFQLDKFVLKSESQKIEGTHILADVFEALCGAIFIDSGSNIITVEKKIIDIFYKDWASIIEGSQILNKNKLLEYLQSKLRFTPTIISKYEKTGPDHDLKWIAKNPQIINKDNEITIELPKGMQSKSTKSKKEADQDLFLRILNFLKKEGL